MGGWWNYYESSVQSEHWGLDKHWNRLHNNIFWKGKWCGYVVWRPYHFSTGHAHCPPKAMPTQSHAHKLLIHSYPQSMPTELLICRSNCFHFSSSIQISIAWTDFSVRGWATTHEFLRNDGTCLTRWNWQHREASRYSYVHCVSQNPSNGIFLSITDMATVILAIPVTLALTLL